MNKTIRITFFVVTFIIIAVLVWCQRVFCRRNDKKSMNTSRLLIVKRNWNRRRGRPASASPLRDHTSNRERSSSSLPLLSPSSSKPPPIGFKYPAIPEISKAAGLSNHIDAYYPSTSGTSRSQKKNNRDSCSTISTCYSATHSAPYSIFSIIPRPSTSRTTYSSDETPESVKSLPYPAAHELVHPPSNASTILNPSGTLCPRELNMYEDCRSRYSSAHEAPYPLCSISVIMERSALAPRRPEHASYEIVDSSSNVLCAPIHEPCNQTTNDTPLLQFTEAGGSAKHKTGYDRTTSFPPVISTTSLSLVKRPPSYEEAINNKF